MARARSVAVGGARLVLPLTNGVLGNAQRQFAKGERSSQELIALEPGWQFRCLLLRVSGATEVLIGIGHWSFRSLGARRGVVDADSARAPN